ncbi:hypothetical protein IC582_001881 [Cucumis melo]
MLQAHDKLKILNSLSQQLAENLQRKNKGWESSSCCRHIGQMEGERQLLASLLCKTEETFNCPINHQTMMLTLLGLRDFHLEL